MYKNLLIALLIGLNFSQVKAQSKVPNFIIYGDSQNIKEVYDTKKVLLKEYEQLVMGLEEDDYLSAVVEYLNYENVEYKNNTLKITLGDGEGKVLKGKLKANYCKIEKDEIETEFFFKKIWQKATS